MAKHVLDTHALIWFLEGNPQLGKNAQAAIADPANELFLPAIVLAEACWVVEKKKCAIPSVTDLLADIDADPRIALVPLDRAILELSFSLTTIPEMHDRQIVATCLFLSSSGTSFSLVTWDAGIMSSGLVPVVW
jgi:PIN domain nuclease of toxin-antitoxin system